MTINMIHPGFQKKKKDIFVSSVELHKSTLIAGNEPQCQHRSETQTNISFSIMKYLPDITKFDS